MSDFSRDELELLAGARRALGPSEQDAARVLPKVRLAIGSGVVPASEAAVIATTSDPGAVLVKKVLTWIAIAGTAAWLGYHAGFDLGERRALEASATRPAAPAQAVQQPGPAAPPIEARPEPTAVVQELPSSQAISARSAEPARRKLKPSPAPAPAPALAPETDEAPALTAPPPALNASLDAETKALRYVERALRNREPHNALARLAQLDAEVPVGQMMEERAAALVMARCEDGASKGAPDHAAVMQRVLEFSHRYPASVYFARVRQTCIATVDRDAATD